MTPELRFALTTEFPADLLVIFTVDQTAGTDAPPAPFPLTVSQNVHESAGDVLASGEFRAGANELLLLHKPAGFAAKRLLLVGLGKAAPADGKGPSADALRRAAGAAVRHAKARGIRSVAIAMPETLVEASDALAARVVAEGAVLADYDADSYKSDRKDASLQALTVLASERMNAEEVRAGFREGVIVAEAQNFARALVNEPGNVLTPTELGRRAAAMAAAEGLGCEVFSTAKLEELKMGAFLAVAKGSEEPPALAVLRYEPAGAPEGITLGLVGKGVTFDTGGISIKPADGMEKMKYDMAGAAAMLGAMQAIARLKPAVRVLCVICSAENMPSGRAYRPGDVLTAMSGKTIEVVNTDAEGRLLLADGLHYARELGATHLVDAATLTGAVSVALGQHNAGAYANNEDVWAAFTGGLAVSGEKFWRLPLGAEYAEQIRSDIADVKQTGGRYGGSITAAMFLKEFVGETPWIHLDIAGTAWHEDGKAWCAKGPSGIGVRSLVEWVRSYGA